MHARSSRTAALLLLSQSTLLSLTAGCSLDLSGTATGPAVVLGGRLEAGADAVRTAVGDAGAHRDELDGGPGDATGDTAVVDGAPPDGYRCGQLEVRFEPRAPTVFILVDRSSSMFERGLWEPLKAGLLTAVERLERDLRFVFSAYTGEHGGPCPQLTAITGGATRDAPMIRAAYDAVAAPPYKGETPTGPALDQVRQLLGDQPPGRKFVLLISDGQPDLCDDGNLKCARDAVIAVAQRGYDAGIATVVVGVGVQDGRAHLEDVANAGAGQPVLAPPRGALDHCPAQARYAPRGGAAQFYEPDLTDPQATSNLLASVLGPLRSCIFDLQGGLAIGSDAGPRGLVELDGLGLPYGEPDGFRVNGPRELELLGRSCARLRQPGARVRIEFPCDVLLAP